MLTIWDAFPLNWVVRGVLNLDCLEAHLRGGPSVGGNSGVDLVGTAHDVEVEAINVQAESRASAHGRGNTCSDHGAECRGNSHVHDRRRRDRYRP